LTNLGEYAIMRVFFGIVNNHHFVRPRVDRRIKMRHLVGPWATLAFYGTILVIVVGGLAIWGPPEVKQVLAEGGQEVINYAKSFWPF